MQDITLVCLLGLFGCFERHGMARDWVVWDLTVMMMNTWPEGRGEKENQLLLSLLFTVMDEQNGVWANGGVHTRPEKKGDGRMVGFTVDWLGLQTRPSSI